MNKTVIFNHIPKTAGTTLRIILNRVYDQERVFFIDSREIKKSLDQFMGLPQKAKENFRVIAGHGADLFSGLVSNPFRVTVLREPVEQFVSQYYYLRKSKNSIYQKEVSGFRSIEQYIDFALRTGQDNLMTRYLSGTIDFLVDRTKQVPVMASSGKRLLEKAKEGLRQYDAVLSVPRFDKGVYRLKELLEWKKIPVYRAVNINKSKYYKELSPVLFERLKTLLAFDLELWDYFLEEELDCALGIHASAFSYKVFRSRQKFINKYLPTS